MGAKLTMVQILFLFLQDTKGLSIQQFADPQKDLSF